MSWCHWPRHNYSFLERARCMPASCSASVVQHCAITSRALFFLCAYHPWIFLWPWRAGILLSHILRSISELSRNQIQPRLTCLHTSPTHKIISYPQTQSISSANRLNSSPFLLASIFSALASLRRNRPKTYIRSPGLERLSLFDVLIYLLLLFSAGRGGCA